MGQSYAQQHAGCHLDEEAVRDAIHVAVLPIITSQVTYPGACVDQDGKITAHGEAIGIIDPFLPDIVPPGTRVYVWLKPNTVSNMVHHWTHPVLDALTDEEGWALIDEVAGMFGRTREAFIECVNAYEDDIFDPKCRYETDLPGVPLETLRKLWECFERLTGVSTKHLWDPDNPDSYPGIPFWCGC